MNKLKLIIKVIYIKYILKQCKGLCFKCDFQNECFTNLE